jgi:hydroxymethylbilane synthase
LNHVSKRFVVGTRTSKLASWQTRRVIEMLSAAWPGVTCETRPFTTKGDKTLDKPLPEIGGKGLFTQELEDALRRGEIDAAVHSLKDLPVEDAPGLTLGAVTARADAGDCLVARDGWTLETLPRGAVVGTSSVRRMAQLLARRPDLEIRSIRGNVETRIRKVKEGQYDATVLARAGVERLGLEEHVTEKLDLDVMLPAPGQGALAVQCRADDKETLEMLAAIDEPATRAAVAAERSFLEGLGGGCSAPVGAFAQSSGAGPPWKLSMRAVVGSPDGKRMIRLEEAGDDPAVLGRSAARTAAERGAKEILSEIEAASSQRTLTQRSPAMGTLSPLGGRRVVVTRSREQASAFCSKLSGLGAETVVIPAIRIVEADDPAAIDRAMETFAEYAWVVFTSVNGVEMFWAHLEARGLDDPKFADAKVAAVGPATADALRERGVDVDFVPESFVGEEIAKGLKGISGKRVLLLRAVMAGDELPGILSSRGAVVDDVAVYRNVPADIDSAMLSELNKGVDVVAFTSGSTVRNFVAAVKTQPGGDDLLSSLRFACIGPATADAARESGLNVDVVAGVHTTDGLIDALVDHFEEEKQK